MSVVLLIASFAAILAGALLFTNAVEWLGHRLEIAEGAVGSLLAGVGTAMPETLIPIVAIIQGGHGADSVAVGAILGAPFLLATIAMTVIGVVALAYRSRRPQGTRLNAHGPTIERDLRFFMVFFALALLLGFGAPLWARLPAALLMLCAYGVYVRRTLHRGGEVQDEESISPLIMDPSAGRDPSLRLMIVQFLTGLAAILAGAHLFVEQLIDVARSIGVEPLVLSLVLAPLATELPEKANSFFWVRVGKDSLALGNVTGAMVFQSTIPVAVGLALTPWELDHFAVLAGVLGLLGGLVAYWSLHLRDRFEAPAVAAWGCLYATFLVAVILG